MSRRRLLFCRSGNRRFRHFSLFLQVNCLDSLKRAAISPPKFRQNPPHPPVFRSESGHCDLPLRPSPVRDGQPGCRALNGERKVLSPCASYPACQVSETETWVMRSPRALCGVVGGISALGSRRAHAALGSRAAGDRSPRSMTEGASVGIAE